MRAIITVAFGKRAVTGSPFEEGLLGKPFAEKLERWSSSFLKHGGGAALLAFTGLPPDSPEHSDVPYAFKAYAIQTATKAGFTSVLWTDSTIYAIRSLAPLWARTERDGYWFSDNWGWNCGQWTSDAALPLLGITREEAFGIPQVAGGVFALDFRKGIAVEFFSRYLEAARNGAFRGPWTNSGQGASTDPRVMGHRHDQTAISVIAHALGMGFTNEPYIYSDGKGETSDTILMIGR